MTDRNGRVVTLSVGNWLLLTGMIVSMFATVVGAAWNVSTRLTTVEVKVDNAMQDLRDRVKRLEEQKH